MKIAFFSSKRYDETFFNEANKQFGFELLYFSHQLTTPKKAWMPVVCVTCSISWTGIWKMTWVRHNTVWIHWPVKPVAPIWPIRLRLWKKPLTVSIWKLPDRLFHI